MLVDSDGSLEVRATTLTIDTSFTIGSVGMGVVSATNGATVTSEYVVLGDNVGSKGILEIDGSTIRTNRFFVIGFGGEGVVSATNGATVTSAEGLYLGELVGSKGILTIKGAGTTWSTGDWFVVGWQGEGTVLISDSAAVTATSLGVTVGDSTGGRGEMQVTSGARLSGKDDYIAWGSNSFGTVVVNQGAL